MKGGFFSFAVDPELEALQHRASEDADAVRGFAVCTPLTELQWLGSGRRRVWAKMECLQRTGSFKIRGAFNALRRIPRGVPVLTASAGNHGLAIATVAAHFGLQANIYVPMAASEVKIRRLRNAGARVVQTGRDVADAYAAALQEARQSGGHYISPFDHPDVVSGQGSLVPEIAAQRPSGFDHLIVPFGGGGLLSGFGAMAARYWPGARLHAVLPSVFGRLQGRRFSGPEMLGAAMPTVADGLAIQHGPDNWLWPVIQSLDPHFHCVEEAQIKAAMLTLLHQESLLAEGAGVIGLSPLLHGGMDDLEGDVLLVLSGGNVSVPQLARVLSTDISDPALRKLNGLRSISLGIELDMGKGAASPVDVPGDRAFATPEAEPAQGEVDGTLAPLWRNLVNHVESALADLEDVLQRHGDYVRKEGLEEDAAVQPFMARALEATRLMIDACREPGLSGRQVAGRYRLLLQQFALARSALAWCSASTDQSAEVMFLDPAEQHLASVNYDRYGSVALRDLELAMVQAMGFDHGRLCALLTSSGQAAYSTIESFLVREVFGQERGALRIARVPYLYFEALEQLEALPNVQVEVAPDWGVDTLVECVERTDSRVVFADPMANIGQLPRFDFQGLARALQGRDWSHRWLVIDGTMVSGGFDPFRIFCEPHHPGILYYESGSKYLQFGLDLQMAGAVVCREAQAAALARHRRNLGAGLYQCQVARFPIFDRPDLLQRMGRLTHNAMQLAAALRGIAHSRSGLRVAYPDDWRERGWAHGGAVVAVTFEDPGLNNRPCLEGLIESIMSRCRVEGAALTQGVSFGFGTTRVSAAAAIAATTDPFLRFSLGEESPERMGLLVRCVVRAINEYLDAF
ncbi:pyridoxal-phosphate dependent enzyme [Paracidovorax oryzae]|uniref:pyridoxal-phosphate dependent enzyme n=1 Tax=Paracidovorax oryzae TaxID=862720 RepID=UPI000A49AE84|nr:pyridoxal-phosphate dependent enzyme [Paracidovorax oryzae]